MSLNGAKNNPKIVTKITAVRPKGGGAHTRPPPLNTPLVVVVVVVVVVVEMNIIKVALSHLRHFCCRTTIQSDSVSVSSQAVRNILSVSRKGRLEQHSLQFPSKDRKRRRILNQLRQSVHSDVSRGGVSN